MRREVVFGTKGIVVYTYKCVPLDPLCPIVLLREDADDVPCVIIVKTQSMSYLFIM